MVFIKDNYSTNGYLAIFLFVAKLLIAFGMDKLVHFLGSTEEAADSAVRAIEGTSGHILAEWLSDTVVEYTKSVKSTDFGPIYDELDAFFL